MLVLNDFDTSVRRALNEIDPDWETYPGLIVCGTHNPHEVDSMLDAIKTARINRSPFLGICFGHQLAAIEYARNVMEIDGATSEEFGKGTFIVKKRPDGMKVGLHEGESWWNNYEVDQYFADRWAKADNFITVQYHPEYNSRKDKPHPILLKFIEHAKLASTLEPDTR